LLWYGAWRYTDTRQAMDVIGERLVLRCAWRHVELCQAVTRKQGALERRWRLAVGEYRQAVWSNFAWRRVGRARRKYCSSLLSWCVVQLTMILCLDREMLCHERVGSWMASDMWWYERGGSYPVTLTWGYERGRFVCSVLTLRDATCGEVRGWWITCVGLRASRSVEQDYEREVRRGRTMSGQVRVSIMFPSPRLTSCVFWRLQSLGVKVLAMK